MKHDGGASATSKPRSGTRFLISTLIASLIAGAGLFFAAGNIVTVSTCRVTLVGWNDSTSTNPIRLFHITKSPAADCPQIIDIQWETTRTQWVSDTTQLQPMTVISIIGDVDSADPIQQQMRSIKMTHEYLDATVRGLVAALFALMAGLFTLFTQRTRRALRDCYSEAPEPRPARYLALMTVLLPTQEQQNWWRELCSALAESQHCDRRRQQRSYLRSMPTLIMTSWYVHRLRPTQRAVR